MGIKGYVCCYYFFFSCLFFSIFSSSLSMYINPTRVSCYSMYVKCCKYSDVCYAMSIVSVANTYHLFDAVFCSTELLNCFDTFLLNNICLNQDRKSNRTRRRVSVMGEKVGVRLMFCVVHREPRQKQPPSSVLLD